MAGIIARMARANWERKKGRLGSRNLTSDKSNKVLPPFGERFVPDLHNTYLRREIKEVLDLLTETHLTAVTNVSLHINPYYFKFKYS